MNKYYKNSKGEIYSFSPIQEVPEGFTKLTKKELDAYLNPPVDIEQLAEQVRAERDSLMRESDWTQLSDSPLCNNSDWLDYRQALRDVPQQAGFPENVVFPDKPE